MTKNNNEYIVQGHESWQRASVRETDVTRVREIFAWFPIYLKRKFAWFKSVYVLQRLCWASYEQFSEWSYQNYWAK